VTGIQFRYRGRQYRAIARAGLYDFEVPCSGFFPGVVFQNPFSSPFRQIRLTVQDIFQRPGDFPRIERIEKQA